MALADRASAILAYFYNSVPRWALGVQKGIKMALARRARAILVHFLITKAHLGAEL